LTVEAPAREVVQLRRVLAQSLVAMRGASLRFAPILAALSGAGLKATAAEAERQPTLNYIQIDAALAAMVELEAAMKEVTMALADS